MGSRVLIMAAFSLGAVAWLACHSAAEDNANAKLPVPGEGAQVEGSRLVREVHDADFRAAKTPVQKLALAKRLLAEGRDTKDDPAGRFALFATARDLAARQGSAVLAVAAIDQLNASFDVNAAAMLATSLAAVAKSATSTAQNEELADVALTAIDTATRSGEFDAARQLTATAQTAARKLRNPELTKRIGARAKRFDDEKKAFEQVRQSLAVLEKSPDDPQANRIVGAYRCFVQDDWGNGLPMLALGDDVVLKSVARAELMPPTDLNEQVTLGDSWWQLSESAEPRDKPACQNRAVHWYRLALPATRGLVKSKIEKRLSGLSKAQHVTRRIQFTSPKILSQFVGPEHASIGREVTSGGLVVASKEKLAATTYHEYFESISSVTIRGAILPPAKHNFRVSVGPINAIFNWEIADEDHLRNHDNRTVLKPSVFSAGELHTIEFKQAGSNVTVSVDGRKLYETEARLSGTVTLYTTKDNTIGIEEIVIEGSPDATRGVEGPSHEIQ